MADNGTFSSRLSLQTADSHKPAEVDRSFVADVDVVLNSTSASIVPGSSQTLLQLESSESVGVCSAPEIFVSCLRD